MPPKVRERARFACSPAVCVHNYAARAERTRRVHVYMRRDVCSAGERLAFDEFVPRTATHIFFFLPPLFFVLFVPFGRGILWIAVKKRLMNFRSSAIVQGYLWMLLWRGCRANYHLFCA